MISEVAEKKFGLVQVGHSVWQFINSNCRGAGSDLAKEILYQPDASFRVVALERSRPGPVRTQTLSEPRQREDRLVERGVEQGVSDELRGAFALPHVFAILLVEAVREREQPSDLSDVLLHKGLFLLTLSDCQRTGSLTFVHSRFVFAAPSAPNTALIRWTRMPKANSALRRDSGESAMNTS